VIKPWVRSQLPRRRINAYRAGHSAPRSAPRSGRQRPLGASPSGDVGARAGWLRGGDGSPRSVRVCDPSDGMSSSRPETDTPRPGANLVRPPLLVMLDPQVVAADDAEQISYVPLTFEHRMTLPPTSVRSAGHTVLGGLRRTVKVEAALVKALYDALSVWPLIWHLESIGGATGCWFMWR
jgi:hypothetical protein